MSKNSRLLLLGISFFVFACSKKIISPVSTQPPKPSLSIEQIDFEYFHGKGRMTLRDANKEVEVKANIRIRKDSVIWMTFSVIGIQGGKALINKDSITIVNNKDNEVYVFEYPELSKRYNFEINYDVIQAVMLGNLIMPRKDNDEVQPVSSMYLLTQRAQTIEVLSYVNAASMKIEKVEMKEGNTNNA